MHTNTYNSLNSVDDADLKLRTQIDFDTLLSKAKKISADHPLGEPLGLYLLPRHHTLVEGEIMVERMFLDENDRPVLSTIPRFTEASARNVPASWILSKPSITEKLTLIPFEYSSDNLVAEISPTILADSSLLDSFYQLLAAHDALSILGLGVVTRKRLTDKEYELWIEEINPEERSQIVRAFKSSEKQADVLIRTRWILRDGEYFGCPTSCVPIPRCIPLAPGHSFQTSHVKGHWT